MIAQVQITADEDKFFSCPGARLRHPRAIEDWKKARGKAVRVELPAKKMPMRGCPGWWWRVLPEETASIRTNWPEVYTWACEHELDMD